MEQNKDFEELEDFAISETRPTYEVWLSGYDENDMITDFEYLVDTFDSPTEATKCAEFFSEGENISKIKNKDDTFFIPADVKTVKVEVETIVTEDDISENIDTIYEEFITWR